MLVNADFNGYVLAWTVYLVASVVFLAASWRFLSAMKRFGVGIVLMMAVVPVILMPWPVDDSTKGMLAPAWVVAGLDRFTNAQDGVMRAGIPLMLAVIFSAGISLLIVAIKAAFFPPAKPHPSQIAAPTTRLAEPNRKAQPSRKAPQKHPAGVAPALENTQRNPRESLAAPPKPKSAATPFKPKPGERIEPRISDVGMDQFDPAPKRRK